MRRPAPPVPAGLRRVLSLRLRPRCETEKGQDSGKVCSEERLQPHQVVAYNAHVEFDQGPYAGFGLFPGEVGVGGHDVDVRGSDDGCDQNPAASVSMSLYRSQTVDTYADPIERIQPTTTFWRNGI